ncbi:hypothetical protein MLD38_020811 [Melastoma candidum]|uniref:Uncharacterized protein n=1 Tax=Melastoma candidum TaxID=119954 RepID=A0ACB9QF20_9MYRT|nr:hypothetical protein MLD38_020811 [Melastoma candidum]
MCAGSHSARPRRRRSYFVGIAEGEPEGAAGDLMAEAPVQARPMVHVAAAQYPNLLAFPELGHANSAVGAQIPMAAGFEEEGEEAVGIEGVEEGDKGGEAGAEGGEEGGVEVGGKGTLRP